MAIGSNGRLAGMNYQSDESGIGFFQSELKLANTFLDLAAAVQAKHRQRSIDDAKKAYSRVLQFMPRLDLADEQRSDFDQQLEELKQRFASRGIALWPYRERPE
jgi:hypothetical protein